MSDLPWSKRDVIDAVIAVYRPVDRKDVSSWATLVCMEAFMRVALGRPEGRAAPYVEHELWLRIGRVHRALHDRRDPNAAYETPIDGEGPLTTDMQLEGAMLQSERDMKKLLDKLDRDL
jgi:hypothetical protein